MLKFKVGDVLVVKEGKNYEPDEQEIKVLEVDEARPENAYRTSDQPDYWWCQSTVEDNYDLKKEKYMKLKKGDKIRITQRGPHEFNKGEVVVVDFTREHADQHVFANHQHKGAVCGYLYEYEYELIEQRLEDEKMSYTNEHMLGKYVRCTNSTFHDQVVGEFYKVIEELHDVWVEDEEPKYCVRVKDLDSSEKDTLFSKKHTLFKDQWEPVTIKEILHEKPHYSKYFIEEIEEDRPDYAITHIADRLMKDTDGTYWNIVNVSPQEKMDLTARFTYFDKYVITAKNYNNSTAVLFADGVATYEAGGLRTMVSFENLQMAYVED